MLDLRKQVDSLGIKIEIIDMESKGCYISGLRTMFINEKLTDEEMKRVILHELKHALDHVEYSNLYKKPITHLKLEAEANDYMIRKIIEENGGVYNYTQLIQEFKIGMGKDVKYSSFQ